MKNEWIQKIRDSIDEKLKEHYDGEEKQDKGDRMKSEKFEQMIMDSSEKFEQMIMDSLRPRKKRISLLMIKDHPELQIIYENGNKLADQIQVRILEVRDETRECQKFIWDKITAYLFAENFINEQEYKDEQPELVIEDGVIFKVEK